MPIFTQKEMNRRYGLLREEMRQQNLSAVAATSYAGFYYLSGAPLHTFGRPAAVIIPLEGHPVIITSILEKDHLQDQSWISDFRCYWDYNLEPVYDDPISPLTSAHTYLKQVITERGWESGRIGFEGSHLPYGRLQQLMVALPQVEWQDISSNLDRLRMTLSAEELTLVRAADAVCDAGQKKLISMLKPGISAREIDETVNQTIRDMILTEHPDKPFQVHIDSGLGSVGKLAGHTLAIPWNEDDIVKSGQVLTTGISVWLWGYWGNVERTVAIGPRRPEVQKPFEIMVEANETAIRNIRPGLKLSDVDKMTKSVFSKHGYPTPTGSGCGRGIVNYEANARELAMDIRLYADHELAPGMAFSLEPDLREPGVGIFRHCNTLIITEDGCEVDSQLPRDVLWS
jgi:Xaa-Pro dipeptidase